MKDESVIKRILHLHTVEKLSFRQISMQTGVDRTTVSKIINSNGAKTIIRKEGILDSYMGLIGQWYKEYPHLKANQVYERLKTYGFSGSCETVALYTREFREKDKPSYHSLEFMPGEEAQIDWVTVCDLPFGKVYGFVFILSYSRYAWGRFYPRNSFEFFLDGHMECFRKIGGVPHTCRYDNLKSVIITRIPEPKYNPQFLDFSRFYRFSIYVCNTYSAHEKGRVERIIRDIRSFLCTNTFSSLDDLNIKFEAWLEKRNGVIHSVTQKAPQDALKEEKLLSLPNIQYQAGKIIETVVSSTGWVEYDTNKYSVPSTCCSMNVRLIVYPDKIVVMAGTNRVSVHKRSFQRNQKIENPLHRESLLNSTPRFKYKRITELIKKMDPCIDTFLTKAKENGEDEIQYAYQLFKLLKLYSRNTVIDCIHKACSVKAFKIKTIFSLLNLPADKEPNPVYPKDINILNINYKERSLEDYDRLI